MKKFARTWMALISAVALVVLSVAPAAADEPVAQAESSGVTGTGLFELLDGKTCTAVFPDGVPTGDCGPGLDLEGVDAYSQTATAAADGHSTADAAVAGTDIISLAGTLNVTDLIAGVEAINTGSVLDNLGTLLTTITTLLETLDIPLDDLTGALDDGLSGVLDGLGDALAPSVEIGAVTATCDATPGGATGNGTVADVDLVLNVGGQQVRVPLLAETTPNSDLVADAPEQLVNDIIDGLQGTLEDSLGGALKDLNPALESLKAQLVGPLFAQLKPALLQPLSDAIEDIVSGTVNKQVPVSPSDTGEIEVTALELKVLRTNELDLAKVHCGPNGVAGAKPKPPTDKPDVPTVIDAGSSGDRGLGAPGVIAALMLLGTAVGVAGYRLTRPSS